MPAMFALADKVIADPTMSYFVAFGSFAMLLLVDFSGSMRDRLTAQAALGGACAVLICLGTLGSESTPVAALAMAVVAFAILFAGVVSSVLASATTALLLAFILPVSLAGPASQIPGRVAGWALAAAASMLAISLLWPSPPRNPVRIAASAACRALAARLRAEVAYVTSNGDGAALEAHQAAIARAKEAVDRLHSLFFATPYHPRGLSTDARALVRLVDELRWLNAIVLRSAPRSHPPQPNRPVCRVKKAAAEVLGRAADLLDAPRSTTEGLNAALAEMRQAVGALESGTTTDLPNEGAASDGGGDEHARRLVSALDPSFRAQELSFVTGQIAANTNFAAAAQRRSWRDRLLGRQPQGFPGALESIRQRAGAHTSGAPHGFATACEAPPPSGSRSSWPT